MPRELTTKQKQFATEIAMGAGKTEAYRRAYRPPEERAPSVYVNAKRIAKLPHIASAIAELRLRYMPTEASMAALYQHGLATMVDLSNSDDPRARFAAAKFLCDEAREHREVVTSTAAAEQDRLLEGLRELYRRIQGRSGDAEELNTDGKEQAGRVAEAGEPIEACGSTEEIEIASDAESPEEQLGAERPGDEPVFVPGRFPPQRIRPR
jgi:hypothetical protein